MSARLLVAAILALTVLAPTARAQHSDADSAWEMLTRSADPGKSQAERIQAMAALGSMGNDPHAAELISKAITGPDMDVRIAAILAAGETKNPELIPALQRALDDNDDNVAYTAAVTLWKLNDPSGEDLLLAVVAGDRKDKLGLMKTEKHKAAKDLHRPGFLTEQAVNNAAGFFIGPFGIGIRAIELAHSNGADPGRIQAVHLLAEQHSEHVRLALIDALADKDAGVRAAAAAALGRWPSQDTAHALLPLFQDDKLAVRLSAAASYLHALSNTTSLPADARQQPHLANPLP